MNPFIKNIGFVEMKYRNCSIAFHHLKMNGVFVHVDVTLKA
jgi:hypothetical protein